jgi:hypothetical protein
VAGGFGLLQDTLGELAPFAHVAPVECRMRPLSN